MDPARLIEVFLEKNGLPASLKALRQDLRRVQLRAAPQLAALPKTLLPPSLDAHHALREHLQKTDAKPLKRFVERARRSTRPPEEALAELPFFQRLVRQEEGRYLAARQEQLCGRKSVLEESRCLENEWEGDNDQGFDAIECSPAELPRALKEIQASKNYQATYSPPHAAPSAKPPTPRPSSPSGKPSAARAPATSTTSCPPGCPLTQSSRNATRCTRWRRAEWCSAATS